MPRMWNNPGKWHVNPLNFAPEVTAGFELPERIFILDSTIRKMTGTPGCKWDNGGAVSIVDAANEVGVGVIEVNLVHGGMPPSKRVLSMFEAIAQRPRKYTLVGTASATKESIDAVVDAGADAVNIGGRNQARINEGAEYAKSRGLKVASTMGARLEHLPPVEAARRLNELFEVDPIYVGIHENTGATTPEAWRYAMKAIRKGLIKDIPIVPHIHNMLGGGAAAAIGAVTGGAQGLDVSMNGIAIHCGLAPLEDVVVMLEVLYGVDTGIDLSKLRDYSLTVVEATGISVHPNKSVVGDHAFICELEPFVRHVLQARETGEERVHPIAPSLVGHENLIVWGDNTTLVDGATEEKLRQMGLPQEKAAVRRVNDAIDAVLEQRTEYPLFLTELEVEELARHILAQQAVAD